jgi:nucleoside-diphosphate-sugar epimerase
MNESTVSTKTRLVDWAAAKRGGVAITGASGWIGAAAVEVVLRALPTGAGVPVRLFGSASREIEIGAWDLKVEPLDAAAPLSAGEWLVLHFAVAGADRLGGDPTALKAANDLILDQTLALARTGSVRRFVYASSGAVYQSGGSPAKHGYREMKRAQEDAVRAWAARTATPLLIPRIFNVGGPHINHIRGYALGDFIAQALEGETIRIKAPRRVIRSYVHVHELAAVILYQALGADGSVTFDTAGPEIVEMADLAEAVARALRLRLDIQRTLLEPGEERYVGDGRAYQAALAQSGATPIGLDQIIRDTAAFMQRSVPL